MSVGDMWKANATTLMLLIVLNLAFFTLGMLPWTILGLICLVLAGYFSFRQGMGYGHAACGILETVRRAQDPGSPAHGQLDAAVAQRAWSVNTGVKGVLASALIPYVAGCAYIVCALMGRGPVLALRLVSWVLAVPYWPAVLPFYDTFDRLTGVVAAVLMISPFALPLCAFAGYMQGPRLWAKSEKAMAEGRRRARAKSRVNRKKRTPRVEKPEI